MRKEIIMRDSPEAVQPCTVQGWVSRRGLFFTDESAARYDGCTHVPCSECGEPAPKGWLICSKCRAAKDLARFQALPRAEWDGRGMLYSEVTERFYEAIEYAEDDLREGESLEKLRLVICTPCYTRPLETDYFADELPDDMYDVPDELIAAIDAFNTAVSGVVLSWRPGKVALACDDRSQP